ncbi:MAG: type II toxin-antitoxin system RelE/ParE family toxin [Planctomycetales bacterium]
MAGHDVTFARSARKELEALDAAIVRRVLPKIEALAGEPRPKGCRKLRSETSLWRIRVGDYRIVYSIDDAERVIDVIAVRHRSAAYD